MSYEELMEKIYAALPMLRGQLDCPSVVYMRHLDKVYMTFTSRKLVDEAAFLKMEAILRQVFPQKPLALRVVSPGLAEDFLRDISSYKQVLVDFLKRNYPGAVAWADQIDWRCQQNRITLTFPDAFSLEYMSKGNVAGRLSQAVKDIFGIQCRVELAVAGDQEKRLEELRQEREEHQKKAWTEQELRERYAAAVGQAAPESAAPKSAPKEKPPREKAPAVHTETVRAPKPNARRKDSVRALPSSIARREAPRLDDSAIIWLTVMRSGRPLWSLRRRPQ